MDSVLSLSPESKSHDIIFYKQLSSLQSLSHGRISLYFIHFAHASCCLLYYKCQKHIYDFKLLFEINSSHYHDITRDIKNVILQRWYLWHPALKTVKCHHFKQAGRPILSKSETTAANPWMSLCCRSLSSNIFFWETQHELSCCKSLYTFVSFVSHCSREKPLTLRLMI